MTSAYFDIYHCGKTSYRSTGGIRLYESPKNQAEREYNKETKLRLSILRAQLELELQEDHTKIMTSGKGGGDFIKFFESRVDSFKKSKGTHCGWLSSLMYFKRFANGRQVTFNELNEALLYGFREYLLTTCSTQTVRPIRRNTALMYFDKFKSAVLKAYKMELIKSNPCKNLDPIKLEETKREYLTQNELASLIQTPCTKEVLKSAFLFACFTGLRHCDITNLRWGDITYSKIEQRWKISYRQQKTKSLEVLPLSKSAVDLILPSRSPELPVFPGLIYDAYMNSLLRKWMMKAGITKNITFHCSRHTFATLLLAKGGQPTTIQKLLGHKSLAQTMIYAKIVDSQKNETVDLLDSLI